MLFVSTATSPSLNQEIFYKPQYKRAVKILKRLGFVQTDTLTFENIKGDNIDLEYVQDQLEYNGFVYNKNLEASIRKEMNSIQANKKPIISDSITDLSLYIQDKNPILLPGYAKRIPEIGEVIEIYFYLFLNAKYDDNGKLKYFLSGDFKKDKDVSNKRFIKIVKSKFIRVNKPDTPKYVNFDSIKTYREILEEIDSLYTANVEIKRPFKQIAKHYASIMEVKSYVNPLDFITICVKDPNEYTDLLDWSRSIKIEFEENKRNSVSVDFLKSKIMHIQKHLEGRIQNLVDEEHYELAKAHKEAIGLLEDKKEFLESTGKEKIDPYEYDKYLSIGEVPEYPILSPFLDYNS